MKGLLVTWLLATCFLCATLAKGKRRGPNIIFIGVKGMGWDDFGSRDSNFNTPNLNMMYANGFRFNYSYVDPDPSATMATILSGRWSFAQGVQDGALNQRTSAHLTTEYDIIPQALKGYKSYFVGEWNQGSCKSTLLPTNRGFKHFFGQLTENADPQTFTTDGLYDFREDLEVVPENEVKGKYLPDFYSKKALGFIKKHQKWVEDDPVMHNKPFFLMVSHSAPGGINDVPMKFLKKCKESDHIYFKKPPIKIKRRRVVRKIDDEGRRKKCAMMYTIDKGMAHILRTLKSLSISGNTLIIFSSLSGGDVTTGSKNWPLRGTAGSVYEGGIRVPTFMYSQGDTVLPVQNITYPGKFHAVDWFQTIFGFSKLRGKKNWSVGGRNKFLPPQDGINFYRLFKRGVKKSFRDQFAYIVNEDGKDVAYVRNGDYKLVYNEETGLDWYKNASHTVVSTKKSKRKGQVHVYNIKRDPLEKVDLINSKNSKIVEERNKLTELLAQFRGQYVPKQNLPIDALASSVQTWGPGSCDWVNNNTDSSPA